MTEIKSVPLERRSVGPHATRPTDAWVQRFLDHVRQTGQPETFPDLDWSHPPAWSTPFILKNFDVDRKKRPDGDMAPCAICSPRRPKCLKKLYLIYYELEGVVRVIGPECGAQIEGGELFVAELTAFKRRERQQRAEATLEQKLPFVPQMIVALDALRPALTEADRLHRKLRGDNSAIARQFRQLKNQGGGLLTVSVEIEPQRKEVEPADGDDVDDNDRPERVGPRGFGRGVDTYTESFGVLVGEAMFASSFTPLENLDDLLAVAQVLPSVSDVQTAFDWMCDHEDLVLFEQIVEQLHKLDAGYHRLVEQLASVRSFFSVEFFSRLNGWGQHRDRSFELQAMVQDGIFSLFHGDRWARFRPDLGALAVSPSWP
ncbi:MAG: hypothetical protein JW889_02285 [Verrucomicrobia bacterium]|nr:hypothetical protein [Verrucomicrobiota bacterium]